MLDPSPPTPLSAAARTYKAPPEALRGRVVLVTGAGQGLGAMAARACAAQGACVVLLGRKREKLVQTYDAIVAAGGPEPLAIPLDFEQMNEADYANCATLVWKNAGRLDAIVHAANALSTLSPMHDQRLAHWQVMHCVNVLAPFALSRACLPLLRRAPDPRIVVLLEQHAFTPRAYWGGYGASQAARAAWVRIAADEWDAPPMPRINLLVPGPIRSPLRRLTHPGEAPSEIAPPEALVPSLLWLLCAAETGRGDVLFLHPDGSTAVGASAHTVVPPSVAAAV